MVTIGANVTVEAPYSYGVTVFGTNAGGVELVVNGTVESHGTEAAISGNGNPGNKGAVTINEGAVVTAENAEAIYHPQGDELTINGGTITGQTAVYIKSGNVEIKGGTLTGNGAATSYSPTGDDCVPTGDALVVDNHNYPGGAPVVKISGGSFNSTNGKGIGSYSDAGTSPGAVDPGLASVIATDNSKKIVAGQLWVTNSDPATVNEYPYMLVAAQDVAASVTHGEEISYYVSLAGRRVAVVRTRVGRRCTRVDEQALGQSNIL